MAAVLRFVIAVMGGRVKSNAVILHKYLMNKTVTILTIIMFGIISLFIFKNDKKSSSILIYSTADTMIYKAFFMSCPFGHKSVKAVPVRNRQIAPDSIERDKIENLEVHYIYSCFDPVEKYVLKCKECKYELFYNNEGRESWARHSVDKNKFYRKLNNIIYNFPVENVKMDVVYRTGYSQVIRNGEVYLESLSFISPSKYQYDQHPFESYVKKFTLIPNNQINSKRYLSENYFGYPEKIMTYENDKYYFDIIARLDTSLAFIGESKSEVSITCINRKYIDK